jgi:electron transfer flavoprotein-quinone oxidoreductase
MLVNGLNREGSNLAMTSGRIAGQVAAEAIKSGDISDHGMGVYETRLRDSFVVKDLYKFRKLNHFLESNPHLLRDYPEILSNAARLYFTADETPKSDRFKEILQTTFNKRSKSGLFKDMFGAWRALK